MSTGPVAELAGLEDLFDIHPVTAPPAADAVRGDVQARPEERPLPAEINPPARCLQIRRPGRIIERMSEPNRSPQFDGNPIPAELISLKAEAIAAHQRAGELVDAWPTSADLAAGRAAISDEQAAEVQALRERERVAVEAMLDHPWRTTVEPSKWVKAREAVAAAARAQLALNQTAGDGT